MSFIGEKISDEDGKKVHWEQYPEYQNLWKTHPRWWAIDRELDVFFWRIEGRMPEQPNEIFGLYWKGALVRVVATYTRKEYPVGENTLMDIYWDILTIKIPEAVELERPSIKSVLEEIFKVYGGSFIRNDFANVFTCFR